MSVAIIATSAGHVSMRRCNTIGARCPIDICVSTGPFSGIRCAGSWTCPSQATNKRGAFNRLERSLASGTRNIVAFGNANLLNLARRDSGVREVLRKFVVLNDGIGADIASRVLFGSKFAENLNGTDFVPYFLSRLRRGARIFLLGARPGIAERAASALLRECPQHSVVGVRGAEPAPRSPSRASAFARACG
jgi:UDP-N-acetyl-D-mannosaminuronic acid transferase (WecB/TagA/CpsF family)